jgi:hypothetical protein
MVGLARSFQNVQQTNGDIGHGVHKSNDPGVLGAKPLICDWATRGAGGVGNSQRNREAEVGAVGASLEPCIHCQSQGRMSERASFITGFSLLEIVTVKDLVSLQRDKEKRGRID